MGFQLILFFLLTFETIWSASTSKAIRTPTSEQQRLLSRDQQETGAEPFGGSMWGLPSPPWAASPPPGEVRHEIDPPSTAASLIGFGAFSTFIALFVVCLRLYARYSCARGLKADDYLIVLAMGFLLGFFAICVRLTVYGVGKHIWDVFIADYTPGILQLIFFVELVGCLMVSFSKLSVLSLYLSITPNKKFRAAVYFLMSIVIAFTVTYVLVQILDCKPVQAQWDLRLVMASHGHSCIDSNVSPMMVLSVVNIIVDVAVVVLPIPVILPLRIPKKDKISCLLLFAAGGGLVSIAAIGRTVALGPLLEPRSMKFVDVTRLVVPELNWAFAEGSVAIIAASLPSIRPLFKRLLSKKERRGCGSNNQGSSVELEDLSHGSRGSKAHKQRQWPHSKDSTLHSRPQDEELGLCRVPGRSAQGSDMVGTWSEIPLSDTPHSNESHAPGGQLGGNLEPRRRVEVSIGDFAVAH